MRVLLLSNLYPPHEKGGAEILAADLARELEKQGHDVCVLTSSFGCAHPESDGRLWRTLRLAQPAHVDRHRPLWRQLAQPYRYYRGYHCASNARELRRVAAAARPDVLYVWEISGLGINSVLGATRSLAIPIVFQMGSYWLLYTLSPDTEQSGFHAPGLKRWLIGQVPRLAWTSMIAVSQAIKEEYARAGFDPARIEVIYNGVNRRFLAQPPAPRASQGTPDAATELLFAGRLRREKGVLSLLSALDLLVHGPGDIRLASRRVHLTVVGDSLTDTSYAEEVRTCLREKELGEFVTLHDHVPQQELLAAYDRADIVVVPSLWKEPFGLVVAEAMARGVPVVASEVGGPSEFISHGVNGLLVAPGDVRALALAMRQLIADPLLRREIGRAAVETARQRFAIERTAACVAHHLHRAVASNMRGRISA